MSSARKRRYEQRLQNQRNREQQVAMMRSWNASLTRVVHRAMLLPWYNPQLLLTYREATS